MNRRQLLCQLKTTLLSASILMQTTPRCPSHVLCCRDTKTLSARVWAVLLEGMRACDFSSPDNVCVCVSEVRVGCRTSRHSSACPRQYAQLRWRARACEALATTSWLLRLFLNMCRLLAEVLIRWFFFVGSHLDVVKRLSTATCGKPKAASGSGIFGSCAEPANLSIAQVCCQAPVTTPRPVQGLLTRNNSLFSGFQCST